MAPLCGLTLDITVLPTSLLTHSSQGLSHQACHSSLHFKHALNVKRDNMVLSVVFNVTPGDHLMVFLSNHFIMGCHKHLY